MRVFLDTNVLASALATRGLCADVLREIIRSHELIVSEPLLAELNRVLTKKFGLSKSLTAEIFTFLQRDTLQAKAGDRLVIPIKDKDDIVLLSSAVSGKADLFVTGDQELLSLGRVGDMEILSPRAFWEKLRKGTLAR